MPGGMQRGRTAGERALRVLCRLRCWRHLPDSALGRLCGGRDPECPFRNPRTREATRACIWRSSSLGSPTWPIRVSNFLAKERAYPTAPPNVQGGTIIHNGIRCNRKGTRSFWMRRMHGSTRQRSLCGRFPPEGPDLVDQYRDEFMEIGYDRVMGFPAEQGIPVRIDGNDYVCILHAHGVLQRP